MKKIVLVFSLYLLVFYTVAQVAVKGISPASVQREFSFNVQANEGGWPGETDDGTWAMPLDFSQPGVYVQGELKMVEDGTPGTNPQGNPISQEGCNSLINDLTGKIAVVYRNNCTFGAKIAYAQAAGAIAVIVLNREDAELGMLADPLFPNDTIPAVILQKTDGDFIVQEMQNGPVVMFIGNKIGVYDNDMATSKADIVMAENTANPYVLTPNGTEFNVDLGLWAYNIGANAQTGVVFDVDVSYMGSSVYSNTSAPIDFISPSGIVLDSQYIDLGNYAPASWGEGTYTITYTIITAGSDDDESDNVFQSQFKITGDNVYSKARINTSNDPIYSTTFLLNESSTQFDDWETCIQFKNANASRLKAMGMTFSCAPPSFAGTMANEIISIRAYTWDDQFTNIFDAALPPQESAWTLTQVGSGVDYFADNSLNGVNIYLPFDEAPITMEDNQRYLFCIFNTSDSLRINFDTQLNYLSTINNYKEFASPSKTLPNGGAAKWYGAGFGYDATPAITVNFDLQPTSVIPKEKESTRIPYPNPVANLLNVPVRKTITGTVLVEVFDLTGKNVLSESKTMGEGPLQINVASIANGSYIFKITFTNGSQDTYKVSINR